MPDQKELRIKLVESLERAVKKYRKAGGETPNHISVCGYTDSEYITWSLDATCGAVEEGSFIMPVD